MNIQVAENPFSVMVFGSAARGDTDSISDRDLLICSNKKKELLLIKDVYEKFGWSVSAYTYNKLYKMSNKKSLFLQHLKKDGVILYDRSGVLNDILKSYNPKNNYDDELYLNTYISSLIHIKPHNYIEYLLIMDMIYVSLRNFGILYLANKKKYEFSYQSIIDILCKENILDNNLNKLYLKIREYKSKYRRMIKCKNTGKIYSFSDREVLAIDYKLLYEVINSLPKEYFPKYSKESHVEAFYSFINGAMARDKIYYAARLSELLIIKNIKKLEENHFRKMVSMTSNPQYYCYNNRMATYIGKFVKGGNFIKVLRGL